MKTRRLLFQEEILRVIQYPDQNRMTEKDFDRLALETFEFQYHANAVYRRFCQISKAATPGSWREIPALPVSAFKVQGVHTFSRDRATVVFQTSGTTLGEKRGLHYFETLAYYDAVIRTAFKKVVLPDRERMAVASLIPDRSEAPKSSLSYMAGKAADFFASGKPLTAVSRDVFHFDLLADFLRARERDAEPYLLMATTFALSHFLRHLADTDIRFKAPPGSRIMETGGSKGRKKEVSRPWLLTEAQTRLGAHSRVINEYGMTELTSQFYDASPRDGLIKGSVKAVPPWTRVIVIDPVTGREAARGQKGLLRIFDLANQGSVMAIQTEDEGRLAPGGFHILGRRKGADARGCSLVFEAEVLCA